MKNRVLAIAFLVIIFSISIINVPNSLKALKPLVSKYVLHNEVKKIDSINSAIESVETTYNDQFVSKYSFVDLNGLTRKLLGNQKMNGALKLKNGVLSFVYDKIDVSKYSEALIELNTYLTGNEIEFMYVAVPYKINPDDTQLPIGIDEYSNYNQDNMLEKLNIQGVQTFDLREELQQWTSNWYDAFFRTDHHWKPETGFWAYTKVAEKINDEFGYELDTLSMDINNYNKKVYKDWFLGSQGKKTGRFYAGGVDSISLITPKFETEMSVKIPIHDIYREGSFDEVMFNYKNIKKDYFNINSYATYIGGDYPLCIQKNSDAVNKEKILILKDSFSLVTQPYYSFMFKQVDVIDLRHFTKETLKEYIDRTEPDIVVALYTSSMFAYTEAFNFGV